MFDSYLKNEPLVSIVLPTFNGERYLSQSIDSCVAQTYKNWELVIVDDASTDKSYLIAEKYKELDNRIRVIRHETNQKLPRALNNGFSNVNGEYLTWTSDDNLYDSNALTEMVTFLEVNPDVDIVYTDYTLIDESGKLLAKREVSPIEELVLGNCIGGSFLYKRIVQEKIRTYADDLFLAEDLDFWLRASTEFKFMPLHKNCYFYRQHKSSLTSLHTEQIRLSHIKTMMRNLPKINWVNNKIKARAYLELCFNLWISNLITDARNMFSYTINTFQLHKTDTEYLVKHLLYDENRLRPQEHLEQVLDFFPNETPDVRTFKIDLWARYHIIKCFEGYQAHKREIVRHHFPKAICRNIGYLNNRGLFRIIIWAYLGIGDSV
jgi:glycosyltransferase involved in cell wall biosynthesis